MVDSFVVRQIFPSISFFFALLRASLGSFNAYCPPVEGFIPGGSGLGFVVANLHPLLHQSLNWFKGMVGEREIVFEARSNELKMGLSSSDDLVEVEGDTIASSPSSPRRRGIRPFHVFWEECALDADTLFRFRDRRFQFPEEVRNHLLQEGEKACYFSPGEVCFYEAAF